MFARGRPSDLTLLIAGGVAIAVLSAVSFLLVPPDSSPQIRASSYSARPDGTKAAYLVLKELGFDVSRSFDALAERRLDPRSTTLLLVSPLQRPSDRDVRALHRFVTAGGIVIAFGPTADVFLPELKHSQVRSGTSSTRMFEPVAPGRLSANVEAITARGVNVPTPGDPYFPAFQSLTEVGVVVARLGEGRIVWCLDDLPIQNEGLALSDNARFVVNAAALGGTRTILWDEHYHGERRSLASYLGGTPLPWAFVQFGVIAAVLFAGLSRRRGPIRPRVVEPRTSPLEFIDTMASLYERAGAARPAIEAARMRLRRRLAAASGLPVDAPDARLAAAGAARLGLDADRARVALDDAREAMRKGTTAANEALAIVAGLQAQSTAGLQPPAKGAAGR